MHTLDTHTMGLADHQSNQKHPVFFGTLFAPKKKCPIFAALVAIVLFCLFLVSLGSML